MKRILLLVWAAISVVVQTAIAQTAPNLGAAGNFTVLAGTEVTSTGATVINGTVGVAPGTVITGFPPGVSGTQSKNVSPAPEAQTNLSAAYNNLVSQSATANLSGQNLGGKTLMPGVYRFTGAANFSGTLRLDAAGDPNAVFIFQVAGNLAVAANAIVRFEEGARARNVYWQVGGTANLGTNSVFKGTLIALSSITANSGAVVQGRLLSLSSFVQLNAVRVDSPLPTSQADLEAVKTVETETPYFQNSEVTYKVVIRNLGPNNETDVLVKDLLPAGLRYVSHTTSSSSYNPVTGIWALGTFANGATEVLQITAQIVVPDFITNTATIAGEGRDENNTNNASSVTICAAPAKPGAITGPGSICTDSNKSFSVPAVPGATYYRWILPEGWSIEGPSNTNSVIIKPGAENVSGAVYVTAGNTCDESLPSEAKLVFSTSFAPLALGPISASTVNPCAGSSGVTYSVAPVAGAERYEWVLPTGWSIMGSDEDKIKNSIRVVVGTTAGTIQVRAINDCGPSNTQSLTVTPSLARPNPPSTITGLATVCSGRDVVFSVTPVAGVDYTWTVQSGNNSWTNMRITKADGSEITVRSGTVTGTISVIATNSCGASSATTKSVTVTTENATAPDRINGESTPCVGQDRLYSVSPVAGMTYGWRIAPQGSGWELSQVTGDIANTSIRVKVGTGSVTLYVSATNACGTSTETSLILRPATAAPPAPEQIMGEPFFCATPNTELEYSILPVTNASGYTWTVAGGLELMPGYGTGTSIRVRVKNATDATIRVTATNGCGSSNQTLQVKSTSGPPAVPGPILGQNFPCVNTSTSEYSVPAVANASEYVWSLPAGLEIVGSRTGTTIRVEVKPGSVGGAITVAARNGCGISGSSLPFIVVPVTVGPFNLGSISGEETPCKGRTITYSVFPIPDVSTYTWTFPSGFVPVGPVTGASVQVEVRTEAVAGTISVVASNGCGSSNEQTLAVVPAAGLPLMPGVISGEQIACVGQGIFTYSVPAQADASEFIWKLPDGFEPIGDMTGREIRVAVRTAMAAGVIEVSAKNGCGTGPKRSLQISAVSALPQVPSPIAGPVDVCLGRTDITFRVDPVAGASEYVWTLPTGFAIRGVQTGNSITVEIRANAVAGDVRVQAKNGCGASAQQSKAVTVSVGPPAAPGEITSSQVSPCKGGSEVTYSVAPVAGAAEYTWEFPAGFVPVGPQTGASVIVQIKADAVNGEVKVWAKNGCGTTGPRTLAVTLSEGKPTALGDITGNIVPCRSATAGNLENIYEYTVEALNPGALNYEWTFPAGFVPEGATNSRTIRVKVNASAVAGTIKVVASNGCGSQEKTLTVTPANAGPFNLGSVSGQVAPCVGQFYEYSVAPIPEVSTYSWTFPAGFEPVGDQNKPTIRVEVKAGAIAGKIKVVASNGCGSSNEQELDVVPATGAPAKPAPIVGERIPCANDQGVSYYVPVQANASRYIWTLPEGWVIIGNDQGNEIVVRLNGNGGVISAKAVNGCGESEAQTLEVTVSTELPSRPTVIQGPANPCANTSTTYQVEEVPGASRYNWELPNGWVVIGPRNGNVIEVQTNGNGGLVKVTAANGCGNLSAQSLAVTVVTGKPAVPGPIVSNRETPCRFANDLELSVPHVAGVDSYTWTIPTGWEILSGSNTEKITVKTTGEGGTVTVVASNGCGTSDPTLPLVLELSAEAPSSLEEIIGNPIPCITGPLNNPGNQYTYSVKEPNPGLTYLWELSEGLELVSTGSELVSGERFATVVVKVRAGADRYVISVKAQNTCGTSAPKELELFPAADKPNMPGEINGEQVPCEDGEVTYSVAKVSGASAYTWRLPTGWTVVGDASKETITVRVSNTPGETGTVEVAASNGCGISAYRSLDVMTAAGAPLQTGPIRGQIFPCENTEEVYQVDEVPGASRYIWTLPAGWTAIGSTSEAVIRVQIGAEGGEISVAAANGCGASVASKELLTPTAGAPPKPVIIEGDKVPCIGNEEAIYQVNMPIVGASSYVWRLPVGWEFAPGTVTDGESIRVKVGPTAGTIEVEARNGCGTSPKTTLEVNPTNEAPAALGPISGESDVCQSETGVIFRVDAVENVSMYRWELPEGWSITAGQETNEITVTVGATGGTIRVTAINGCGDSNSQSMEVTTSAGSPGQLGAIIGSTVPCVRPGAAPITYQVAEVTGAVRYTWSVPATWEIVSGQGTNEISVLVGLEAGPVEVLAWNGCGENSQTLEVTPATAEPATPGPIKGEASLCAGQKQATYSVDKVPGAAYYTWTLPDPSWTIISGQGTETITVNAGVRDGAFVVVAGNDCGTSGPRPFTVTFLPAAAPPEEIIDESAPCKGLIYSVPPVTGATSYTWTVPEGWSIAGGHGTSRIQVKALHATDKGYISVVANNNSCTSESVELEADAAKGETDLVLPNVFSPNGDGINDTWIVANLDKFPENELVILNRWGSEIFRRKSYQNDWVAEGLSAGTYFYVLRVKQCEGAEKTLRGFVMIVK